MPKIHVLDKAVAELIAAGEVVERPASIVKELIENAIDAGSTAVTVEIRGGGIGYIRVSDNGCGIAREDIPNAFLRHATSKVRTADDLTGILTLGFRGEALASIAAMCRVELTTKTAGETEGTLCRAEGGEVLSAEPVGCPTGTTIVVRDVFYNTPARMKFLKKDTGEGNAVALAVDKCALSHPKVAFRFLRDGQDKLRTSGGGDLLAVIRAIYGKAFADGMLSIKYDYEDKIRVHGYVSNPSDAKASRTYQNFFLNGRYVRSRTASAALEEGFKNKLMSGKFPACVLNLHVGAETVDVNVHPAKIEVRFADEKPVFHAVYFAVKSALAAAVGAGSPGSQRPEPPPSFRTEKPAVATPAAQPRMTAGEFRALFDNNDKPGPRYSQPVSLRMPNIDVAVDEDFSGKIGGEPSGSDKKNTNASGIIWEGNARIPPRNDTISIEPLYAREEQPQEESHARLIGEAFSTYILVERADELLLVDKHAAHERILYERLKARDNPKDRQVLLEPQAVTLSKEDYNAVIEGHSHLEGMGFSVDDFGDGTVLVREVPVELGQKDIAYIIGEIAAKLRAGNLDLTPEVLDRLYYSIACRAAVKGGDRNHPVELEAILHALGKNPDITHCPHGRPVTVALTRRKVEKLFGRLG